MSPIIGVLEPESQPSPATTRITMSSPQRMTFHPSNLFADAIEKEKELPPIPAPSSRPTPRSTHIQRGPEQYEMTLQIYENSPKPSQILSFPLLTVLAFVNNTSHNIPLQSRQPCHLYAANFQSPAFNYSAVYYRLNESRASIPTLLTVLSLKNLHELKDNKL